MATSNAINSPDIDGGTLIGVTVASDDKIIIQDTSDGNRIKTVPVSSIASPSGLVFLASRTAANQASVNFDNLLTSTYNSYFISFEDYTNNTAALQIFQAQFGTTSTPTYQTSLYIGSSLNCFGTPGVTVSGTSAMDLSKTAADITSGAGFYMSGTIFLHGINSANYKSLESKMFYRNASSVNGHSSAFCAWTGSTVVTSIKFIHSTGGNIATGTWKLYGIANS